MHLWLSGPGGGIWALASHGVKKKKRSVKHAARISFKHFDLTIDPIAIIFLPYIDYELFGCIIFHNQFILIM
jgi:hypothetical protein